MEVFIELVGARTHEAFEKFMHMMEFYESTPKNSFSEFELKELDRLSCEVVTLMTSKFPQILLFH